MLDSEEQKLRSNPGDGFRMPADVFNTSVGRFWGIFGTRDYMRARYGVVEALRRVKTPDAVRASLDHLMDMLRLCRGDNMGVRDLVPALMLQLGLDQECYDFVKLWAMVREDNQYNWGNMDLPYLDVKDADALEPVEYLCGRFPQLSHVVAITLLKIRMLLDVKASRDASSGDQTALRSSIIQADIDKLDRQVNQLYKTVKRANGHFWPSILEPAGHLKVELVAYSKGSVAEMQMALQYSYDSWSETPGAIEFIRQKS